MRMAEPLRHPQEREVVSEDRVAKVIKTIHCMELSYAGKNKTFQYINDHFYGINKSGVLIPISKLLVVYVDSYISGCVAFQAM